MSALLRCALSSVLLPSTGHSSPLFLHCLRYQIALPAKHLLVLPVNPTGHITRSCPPHHEMATAGTSLSAIPKMLKRDEDGARRHQWFLSSLSFSPFPSPSSFLLLVDHQGTPYFALPSILYLRYRFATFFREDRSLPRPSIRDSRISSTFDFQARRALQYPYSSRVGQPVPGTPCLLSPRRIRLT